MGWNEHLAVIRRRESLYPRLERAAMQELGRRHGQFAVPNDPNLGPPTVKV